MLLLLLKIVAGLIAVVVLKTVIKRLRQALPGPMALPIVDVPAPFLKKGLYLPTLWLELYRQYGSTFEVNALGTRTVVFTRPDDVAQVLGHEAALGRITSTGEEGLARVRFSKRGIVFNNDIDSWRRQRRVFHKGLRPNWLQEAISVSLSMSKQAMKKALDEQKEGAVDIYQFCSSTALMVILRIAFGEAVDDPKDMQKVLELVYPQFFALGYFLHTPPWMYKVRSQLSTPTHARTHMYNTHARTYACIMHTQMHVHTHALGAALPEHRTGSAEPQEDRGQPRGQQRQARRLHRLASDEEAAGASERWSAHRAGRSIQLTERQLHHPAVAGHGRPHRGRQDHSR